MVPCLVPTSTVLSQVTLAVPGLSRDNLPHNPCGRVSAKPPGGPGTLWQSIPVHRSNIGSPGIILGLPHPPAPLWQSILVCQSYPGSPGIILGIPHPPNIHHSLNLILRFSFQESLKRNLAYNQQVLCFIHSNGQNMFKKEVQPSILTYIKIQPKLCLHRWMMYAPAECQSSFTPLC